MTGLHAPGREALLSATLALAAVAAALVSQHQFDMQPCPWCVLQRLIFVAGAAVALMEASAARTWNNALRGGSGLASGFTSGQASGLRLATGLRLTLALAGLAAALWQHFVAAASASCNLTLADRLLATTGLDGLLPDIFQPRASCLEAKAWLLGVPYEFWSAALFAVLGVLALATLMGWTQPRRPPLTGSSTA